MEDKERLTEHELERMIAGDFVRGVLLHLARRNGGRYPYDVNEIRLHTAFKAAYDALVERAEQEGVNVRFSIMPDRMHGVSETLNTELSYLLYTQEAYGYGSYVHLVYDADGPIAEVTEEHLPGSSELYEHLADVFTETYESRPPY